MTFGAAPKDDVFAQSRSGAQLGAAERPGTAASEKQRWIEENREAFAAYDAMVEKFGVFGDGRRLF